MSAHQRDAAASMAARYQGAASATAGGTGDATEVSGGWIDRQNFLSAKLIINYKATLADTETISVAANLQDASSSGGTGAADYGTALASTVQATSDGGTAETGVVELDFDLSGAKQYIQAQFTPDLSASGTDTAIVSAVLVLAGNDNPPVTARANS